MEIRTTTVFHMAGYSYAIFCWGLFSLYCIGYQVKQWRIFWHRRQKLNKLDDKAFDPCFPWEHWLRPLDRVVSIPFVTEMIAVKHIVGMCLFVIVNVIFILFAPFKWTDGFTSFRFEAIGLYDRRCAFMGMVNWAFVFILASRNSILTSMSGFTFESIIPYHRWVARVGLLEFIPHFVWRMYKGYIVNYVVADTLFCDLEQTSGTICMFGFLLLFVTSFSFVRRRFFEFFYYAHLIGIVVAIIFACIHEPACFLYFIPAVILWVADRAWRSYQSWLVPMVLLKMDTAVTKTETQEGISRMLFDYAGMTGYQPGQYVFLALARKKANAWWLRWRMANWHPITVSEVFPGNKAPDAAEKRVPHHSDEAGRHSISLEGTTSLDTNSLRRRASAWADEESQTKHSRDQHKVASLHIKALGGFSRDLLRHADEGSEVYVKVDGPYGPRLAYQDYQVLACYAAGIGITPALTLIKDCVERRASGVSTVSTSYVQLVWVVRSTEETLAFHDQILYWRDRAAKAILPVTLDLQLYVTREPRGEKSVSGFDRTRYGQRPQMDECMNTIPVQHHVCVHTCGSDAFMSSVINEASRRGWHHHHETFEF
ncbi:hypothetical protein DM01DRAFT_1326206 [Hesseltinella vesiculosa]|uniref:FAD-binding FR-type domain-containing protein n=1 Tax=Hesseltinella vesiculosa TaxID=101127 RepID=A0A1X2G9G1_9FUNG|nr:hypothetical protein DM01DRAFT_1326206 [Hesseltinella vesiculosa]